MARNNKKERLEEIPELAFRLTEEEIRAGIPTYFKDAYPHRVDEVVARVQDNQLLYSVLVEIQGQELVKKIDVAGQGLSAATKEAAQALRSSLTEVVNEAPERTGEERNGDQ